MKPSVDSPAAIIDIARDLWKDRKNIPPRVGERNDQILDEYKKRGLSTAPPNKRTITRAFDDIKNADKWELWMKAGPISEEVGIGLAQSPDCPPQ